MSTLAVPPRLIAGEPFRIKVATEFGDCERPGKSGVEFDGRIIRVRMITEQKIEKDKYGEYPPCSLGLNADLSDVQLPGLAPGVWELQILGKRLDARDVSVVVSRRLDVE